jgi:hypothetical protein
MSDLILRVVLTISFVTAAFLLVSHVAQGAGPTVDDFATCNAEAADKTRAPSAAPRPGPDTSGSERRAPGGLPGDRGEGPRAPTTESSGPMVTRPSDPQSEGMAAAGATDRAYREAYRACMRRRGF